ncbi:MAG: DNA polymerase III subunit beta [Bryobacterales bacterium]|nr:DNA polymerase III subunit beta [Bryobacterales bacterium]
MEFTVSKAELVRELNLSQGVVEKKSTIPILANVLLEAAGDQVTMTATDLELGIRCSFQAGVRKEGAGTLPARRLLDYVRLLPDADVNVKFLENQWASLVCGRSRTRMAGMSRESYPELPAMPPPLAVIPAKDFAALIGRTIFAISTEESRFSLNGGLLVLKETGSVMVSTDGHRLAYVEMLHEQGPSYTPYRALIPRKAMAEIYKLAQESPAETTITFAGDENHLFFRVGERLLISRRLTGNFPDYDRVLPKEQPHQLVLGREEVRAAVERVAQFSDERSHAIRFQIAPGELKIYSSMSETGESEESVPSSYDGPPVEIGFNAQYLLDFLRASGETEVTLQFRDAQSAGEWRPAGSQAGSEYRYVVMPMRI